MTDLIQQLEQASAGSRELDVLIHIVVHNPDVMTDPGGYKGERPVKYDKAADVFNSDWLDWEGAAMTIRAPHYSTSLDAALSLVPEGWDINSLKWFRDVGADCTLYASYPVRRVDASMDADTHNTGFKPTPALALCIASLKAIEAETE